jgi:hypothetical protein
MLALSIAQSELRFLSQMFVDLPARVDGKNEKRVGLREDGEHLIPRPWGTPRPGSQLIHI